MSDQGYTTERWIYTGRRQGASGKLLAAWQVQDTGEQMLYAMGKGVTARAVGATYEVECKREGDGCAARLSGATLVAVADDDDAQVQEWEAQDRTAYTADALRKREAKAKASGTFGDITLDALHDLYWRTPAAQQAALLGQVLRHVTSKAST